MRNVTTIGLDLAKSVFHVHGVDADGMAVLRQRLTSGRLLKFFAKLPPCLIGIEACVGKPMWVGLARKPEWRCLIPFTHFPEAEGVKGAKTRTWFSVKDQPIAACAGLWRMSKGSGPVYSGLMTDCN